MRAEICKESNARPYPILQNEELKKIQSQIIRSNKQKWKTNQPETRKQKPMEHDMLISRVASWIQSEWAHEPSNTEILDVPGSLNLGVLERETVTARIRTGFPTIMGFLEEMGTDRSKT